MSFPCDAVHEPTAIEVHRWKSTACSPPLQEHEAVVSNVIEISTSSNVPLPFTAEVKLTLCHSAADLHGYELVVSKLTNKDTNEWEDVVGTEDFWSLSGKHAYFFVLFPLMTFLRSGFPRLCNIQALSTTVGYWY